jgi:hypothetical protein
LASLVHSRGGGIVAAERAKVLHRAILPPKRAGLGCAWEINGNKRCEVRVLLDGIRRHADDLASAVYRVSHAAGSAESTQLCDATILVPEHRPEFRKIEQGIDQAILRDARDQPGSTDPDGNAAICSWECAQICDDATDFPHPSMHNKTLSAERVRNGGFQLSDRLATIVQLYRDTKQTRICAAERSKVNETVTRITGRHTYWRGGTTCFDRSVVPVLHTR